MKLFFPSKIAILNYAVVVPYTKFGLMTPFKDIVIEFVDEGI
jgi:hypothetical protein